MKKKISKKLTDRSISALKPGKQPYLVYDTEVGKLAVRVMPSGKTTYVVYARMPGAKNASVKKIAGDASTQIWKPQDARERAQVLLNKIAIGLDPFHDGRTGVTFEEAYLEFLKDSLQKKGVTKLGVEDRRFWPDLERQQFNTYRRFAAAHKSILLSDATEKKVADFLGDWHKSSKHGARKARSALRQLFLHHKVKPNPADAYPSISPPTEEVKFMEEEEHFNMINFTDQLIEDDPVKGSALKFLALTGLRPSEGLTLERKDTGKNNYIDRRNAVIVLRKHKTQRSVASRHIPVLKAGLEVLDAMDAAVPMITKQDFLFPDLTARGKAKKPLTLGQTNNAFKIGWHKTCDALGLPEYKKSQITQRHFRHTFGTRVIAEEMMTLEMLKTYFGHTSVATTQKYVGAAERTNNRVAAAVNKLRWS